MKNKTRPMAVKLTQPRDYVPAVYVGPAMRIRRIFNRASPYLLDGALLSFTFTLGAIFGAAGAYLYFN